ncbi:hypothetical protein PVK06_044125 [Gossypium arboreum]|uniref:Aminotransferase-like plant mobile domain-containing protein n=1 Tax=Gossypium arboreum TaxID=29729 RepID=A0ABR0MQB0_GOSAR|nr:hypothetical protein PVK06_044125 [Gossypium arboreum]
MSVDRVLQCYIRNMSGPPSPLIENYLREANFWHVATIGRGCKLDLKLISALIKRWRPETYTFYLSCEECTITLEDVQLQLGLPVDGYAVIGSAQSTDLGVVCYELLGAILDNINGGQIEKEPIIVPELAYLPEYMPWFRIHGKPYLLSEEKRRRQIHVQRERQGPLNPRRKDDDAGPSAEPINSAHTATYANTSTDETHITAFSDYAKCVS